MCRTAERLACCALVAALGCALRIPPAPIPAHLDWPVVEDGDAGLPRLGVGPFVDARSAAERRGSQPPLRVRWRGLVREGENRTGDGAFSDAVPESLRRDVLATLARSGDFSRVRPVDFHPAVWPRELDLDYALVASVETFEGLQYQRSELSPFWIGWVRNRYEAPVGSVRVHYELYDPGGLVWEGEIETQQESGNDSVTGAVLDAMAMNSERLAGRLHAATRAGAEPRVIGTRVLDGCRLGRRGVVAAMEEVALTLEREAALRLEMDPEPWMPPGGVGLEDMLHELVRGAEPPADGIVIALLPIETRPQGWLSDRRYGIADPLGSHLIVGCAESGGIRTVTAIHEIGHLLGAIHVRDRSSVMHAVADFDARFFDPLNRRILRTARERPFGEPLPAPLERRLDAIYRAAARFPEWVDAGDLEAALTSLRVAARRPSMGATETSVPRASSMEPTAPR